MHEDTIEIFQKLSLHCTNDQTFCCCCFVVGLLYSILPILHALMIKRFIPKQIHTATGFTPCVGSHNSTGSMYENYSADTFLQSCPIIICRSIPLNCEHPHFASYVRHAVSKAFPLISVIDAVSNKTISKTCQSMSRQIYFVSNNKNAHFRGTTLLII